MPKTAFQNEAYVTGAVRRDWCGDLFEKRRALAEAWARFCAGTAEGNVVPLREASIGGR